MTAADVARNSGLWVSRRQQLPTLAEALRAAPMALSIGAHNEIAVPAQAPPSQVPRHPVPARVRMSFDAVDRDKSGFLEANELEAAFTRYGINLNSRAGLERVVQAAHRARGVRVCVFVAHRARGVRVCVCVRGARGMRGAPRAWCACVCMSVQCPWCARRTARMVCARVCVCVRAHLCVRMCVCDERL